MCFVTAVVPRRGNFAPWDIWQCLEYFWLSQPKSAAGTQWIEARDDAQQPTMHKTVPTAKNDSVPEVNSAEAKKL